MLLVLFTQYNSSNVEQRTFPLPTYNPWPRFVVLPTISVIEINCALLVAENENHTSSSISEIQSLSFPEGVALVIVPLVTILHVRSALTAASIAPSQLSFSGGHANSWIGLLLITQFTSSSLDTVIIISVWKGYGPICTTPVCVTWIPADPWLSEILTELADPRSVIFTSIKNCSPFAQSSITEYSADGFMQVAQATV